MEGEEKTEHNAHAQLEPIPGSPLWPRMRVCILLAFLVKFLQSTSDNHSSRVFRTLAFEDVSKISLVEQCKLLESEFGTSFAAQCLNNPENAQLVLQEAKEALISI